MERVRERWWQAGEPPRGRDREAEPPRRGGGESLRAGSEGGRERRPRPGEAGGGWGAGRRDRIKPVALFMAGDIID